MLHIKLHKKVAKDTFYLDNGGEAFIHRKQYVKQNKNVFCSLDCFVKVFFIVCQVSKMYLAYVSFDLISETSIDESVFEETPRSSVTCKFTLKPITVKL